MNNSPIKLLVIDDDEVDRLHLKRSLKAAGLTCEITECHDTKTALQTVFENHFDCVFLDYLLPGDNGLLLLKKIRDKGITIPIVITTSQGSESIAVELMKAGASDYVIKNQINETTVERILKNIIRTARAEQEREKAVEALKVSESRLAEAQRIAKIGNWEVDIVDNSVYWSDQVYKIFKLSPSDFVPTIKNYINLIDRQDRELIRATMATILNNAAFNLDIKITAASEKKYVNIQGYVSVSEGGVLQKIFGTLQDITERKQAEHEILMARELAENSLNVRELFLANMSHEIRTPMNAVIGFTQLLYDTPLSVEQKSFIDAINFSGENLLVIINDILDLSKLQSGKLTLEEVEFDIHELVNSVINSLIRKAHAKSLQLTGEIKIEVPQFVKGDSVRLNQVLTNLLNNAIKFTERGYVHLQVSSSALENEKYSIDFAIRDTGIGIAIENQSQIFESFVQASSNTTRKYGGTGLGLTIVKNIIDLQKGKISLQSMPGYGSTFLVQLLFEPADQNIVQIRNQVVDENEPLHLLSNATILVVEDNPVNQLLIRRVLEKSGCKMEIVSNGLLAIEQVKTGDFDVVLMDLQMPEMDGYEATKFIRNNMPAPQCHVPIIALTAHALISEIEKCISIGMNDFITKPFKRNLLFSKIIKQLKRSLEHQAKEQEVAEALPIEIDLHPLYALHVGDRKFIKELMLRFEKQTPSFITKLRGALKNNNQDGIEQLCKQIQSSYGIVSLPQLNAVLEEVMVILQGKKPEQYGRLTTLVNVIISLLSAITEEMQRSNRKTG